MQFLHARIASGEWDSTKKFEASWQRGGTNAASLSLGIKIACKLNNKEKIVLNERQILPTKGL